MGELKWLVRAKELENNLFRSKLIKLQIADSEDEEEIKDWECMEI